MGRRRQIGLIWPMAGLNKALPKAAQPPYSTPSCQNVWVRDSIRGNARLGGGSRPGLLRSFMGRIGDGNKPPVLMNTLHCYRNVDPNKKNYSQIDEEFVGKDLSSAWHIRTANNGPVTVNSQADYANQVNTVASTYYYDEIPIDTNEPYMVEGLMLPVARNTSLTMVLYFGLNDATPRPDYTGFTAKFQFVNSGQVYVEVQSWQAGVMVGNYIGTETFATGAFSGWLRIRVVQGGAIKVYVRDTEVVDWTSPTWPTGYGKRVGFSMYYGNIETVIPGQEIGFSRFRVQYYPTDNVANKRYQLIASGSGKTYVENGFEGQMNELVDAITLNSDVYLDSAPSQGQLFIADRGPKKADGIEVTVEDSNAVITSATPDGEIVTVVTTTPSYVSAGSLVTVVVGNTTVNGSWIVKEVIDDYTFTYDCVTTTLTVTGGLLTIINQQLWAVDTGVDFGALGIDVNTDEVYLSGRSTDPVVAPQAIPIALLGTGGNAYKMVLWNQAIPTMNVNDPSVQDPQTIFVGRCPKYYAPNEADETKQIKLWDTGYGSNQDLTVSVNMIKYWISGTAAHITTDVPNGLKIGDVVILNQSIGITQNGSPPYTGAGIPYSPPLYIFQGVHTVTGITDATTFVCKVVQPAVAPQPIEIKKAQAKGRFSVVKAKLVSNVVTLTLGEDNSIHQNDTIVVDIDNTDYNGTFTCTGKGPRTITYALTHADITEADATGSASNGGGTVDRFNYKKGVVPFGCEIIALYRGRLVLAGDPENPQQMYASRQQDPFDFDYGAFETDAARAWTTTAAAAGEIGDVITALIPINDDLMLIGCRSSIWLLRGDITDSGQLDNISRNIGIVSSKAWCYLPAGGVMFMSNVGLHIWSSGSPILNVTSDNLPNQFFGISPEANRVTMMWDTQWRGAHIFLSPVVSGNIQYHYWMWMEEGKATFWPMKHDYTQEPVYLADYRPATSVDNVNLLLGRDGYIRNYWNESWNDDMWTAIESYIDIGPIVLGGDQAMGGMFLSIQAILPRRSGDVVWRLYTGNSAVTALPTPLGTTANGQNNLVANGTFAALRSYVSRPNKSGVNAYVRLLNGSDKPWAFENLLAEVEKQGIYQRTSANGK